jgi:fatty-acyl-CoA synthase
MVIGATYYTVEYFDEEESLKLIEKEKCTMQIALSTFFIKQMEVKGFERYNISSLRTGFCGGGPELQRRVISKMGIEGLCNLYGLSECSPNVTLTSPDDDVELRIHKMGKPHPGVELKIVDMDNGSSLPANQEGEICVRGWNVMKGYYQKPEETAKAIDADGWLHTGDLGTLDEEGCLTFTGRLKNIVRVGGENVSTEEVENFLMGHPKVKYAEVIGVPDAKLDEVVMAFIELREREACSEKEIIDFCKGRIANFKIPRYVRFVHEFPMTASGKVKKYELRESVMGRSSRQG